MPIRNRTGKKRDKMRSSSTSPARLTETREFETIPLQRRVKQGLGFRRSASASVLAATAIIAATETRCLDIEPLLRLGRLQLEIAQCSRRASRGRRGSALGTIAGAGGCCSL